MLALLLLACGSSTDPAEPPLAAPNDQHHAGVLPSARFGEGPDWPRWAEGSDALSTWAGQPVVASRNPGTGTLEDARVPTPLTPREAVPALLQALPELWGSVPTAELVKPRAEPNGVRWEQARQGVPVWGAYVEARREGPHLRLRARLLPAGPDAVWPDARPTALATARAALAEPPWSGRHGASAVDQASPCWFDPGMLYPERATGPRPAWAVRGAGSPSPTVLVSGDGLRVLHIEDTYAPQGQLHGDLVSYLRPGSEEHPEVGSLLDLLTVEPGMVVADVGAGSGTFAWPLARRVGPAGRVWATDVDPVAVDFMQRRLRDQPPAFANVEVLRAFVDDPRLPEGAVDRIFMNQVHFFIGDDVHAGPTLRALGRALAPGGRMLVVETSANITRQDMAAVFEREGWVVEASEHLARGDLAFWFSRP